MAKLFTVPSPVAFNSRGLAVPGATASLYTTGTTTPQNFYSDSGLTTSLGSTITSDAIGRFPVAYQDESTAYRLIVKDADGAELADVDPFYFGSNGLIDGSVHIAALENVATDKVLGRATAGTGPVEQITCTSFARSLIDDADAATARATLAINATNVKLTESLIIACSDETTALTAGTSKTTLRMPYAFTVSAVRASLSTAQATGSIFTVDINEAGTSILSTKLTIDNTEKTSTTAATAAVISDSSIADDAEITVDIDQIGDGTAKGLKVCLIGSRT
jgi:hypothetical protein